MIKMGLIGGEHFSAPYIAGRMALNPLVDFIGMVDEDDSITSEWAAKFGCAAIENFNQFFALQPMGLAICAQPGRHMDIVMQAAEEGIKRILCVTPLAENEEDARTICDLCRMMNIHLTPVFPCRYAIQTQRIRKMIVSKRMRLKSFRFFWDPVDKSQIARRQLFSDVADLFSWLGGATGAEESSAEKWLTKTENHPEGSRLLITLDDGLDERIEEISLTDLYRDQERLFEAVADHFILAADKGIQIVPMAEDGLTAVLALNLMEKTLS